MGHFCLREKCIHWANKVDDADYDDVQYKCDVRGWISLRLLRTPCKEYTPKRGYHEEVIAACPHCGKEAWYTKGENYRCEFCRKTFRPITSFWQRLWLYGNRNAK